MKTFNQILHEMIGVFPAKDAKFTNGKLTVDWNDMSPGSKQLKKDLVKLGLTIDKKYHVSGAEVFVGDASYQELTKTIEKRGFKKAAKSNEKGTVHWVDNKSRVSVRKDRKGGKGWAIVMSPKDVVQHI